MVLLGGAGPAVVAGLCAFAALGYAIYQVTSLAQLHLQLLADTKLSTRRSIRMCIEAVLLRRSFAI